jgi:hypothetical protein
VGKVYDGIDAHLATFMASQPMFFVATAPRGDDGRVNVSPKGYADTFAIIDARTVAYLDLTGSGIETVAHLRENGRITIMFCAFEGEPMVLRLQGQGRVVERGEAEFDELATYFGERAGGGRAVIVVDVERVSDSCGYSVPYMRFEGERERLTVNHARRGADGLHRYQRERNAESIDGLPGLAWAEAEQTARQER